MLLVKLNVAFDMLQVFVQNIFKPFPVEDLIGKVRDACRSDFSGLSILLSPSEFHHSAYCTMLWSN